MAGNTFVRFEGDVLEAARAIQSNLRGTESDGFAKDGGFLSKGGAVISNLFSSVPDRVNFAVFGVDGDEGVNGRTDTIIVGSFNTKTEELTLVSVPRDTYVVMPEDRRKVLTDAGRRVPANGVMKVNAINVHSGRDWAMPFAVKQLEELIGIEIQYYIRMDLDGFKFIVDEIGGVEFDVPQRMYYNDRAQNLHIDLQPGLQRLNGKQAEGLVRYRLGDRHNPQSRGYARGDLQRVEVQQDFTEAFLAQVFSKSNIIGNLPAFAETVFGYVETNFALSEVPKFSRFALSFKGSNVTSVTLPGVGSYMNGVWYFVADEGKVRDLADERLR
jgi:LCP family protein required for cell wall assembly